MTTSNLTKSLLFYTQVLGGVAVDSGGYNLGDSDTFYYLLFQKELLELKKGQEPYENQIPDIKKGGVDTFDAVYVNFGALQVELLDYHAKPGMENETHTHFYHKTSTSPAIVRNMHICWYLEDDADLNEWVLEFETKAQALGFEDVKCNRVIKVDSNAQRVQLGQKLIYNSYEVPDGQQKGWSLAYCKGPDGEQFEIAQALSKSKVNFEVAQGDYLQSK